MEGVTCKAGIEKSHCEEIQVIFVTIVTQVILFLTDGTFMKAHCNVLVFQLVHMIHDTRGS